MEDIGLTREQAIQSLKEGKILKHIYFSPEEFVYQKGDTVFTASGYKIHERVFWNDRAGGAGDGFDYGWEAITVEEADEILLKYEKDAEELMKNLPRSTRLMIENSTYGINPVRDKDQSKQNPIDNSGVSAKFFDMHQLEKQQQITLSAKQTIEQVQKTINELDTHIFIKLTKEDSLKTLILKKHLPEEDAAYDGMYLALVEDTEECGTKHQRHYILENRMNKWILGNNQKLIWYCNLPKE